MDTSDLIVELLTQIRDEIRDFNAASGEGRAVGGPDRCDVVQARLERMRSSLFTVTCHAQSLTELLHRNSMALGDLRRRLEALEDRAPNEHHPRPPPQ